MTDLSIPTADFVAGTTIQSSLVDANNQRLVDGLNLVVDSGMATMAGLNVDSGTVRRGVTAISGAESRTSTSYGKMATPDEVASVVVPTNGLIVVAFRALWQSSVANAAKAAMFLGATQVDIADSNVPFATTTGQEVPNTGSGTAQYGLLFTHALGLATVNGMGAPPQDTPPGTGVILGMSNTAGTINTGGSNGNLAGAAVGPGGAGGFCVIEVDAGTYTLSIQTKSTSGSVTMKDRKLWVWTVGFA